MVIVKLVFNIEEDFMKKCPKCGAFVGKTQEKCRNCGFDLLHGEIKKETPKPVVKQAPTTKPVVTPKVEATNKPREKVLVARKVEGVIEIVICPRCGGKNAKSACFCSHCGQDLRVLQKKEEPEVKEEPKVTCANCGKENVAEAIYCINCGKKLVPDPVEEEVKVEEPPVVEEVVSPVVVPPVEEPPAEKESETIEVKEEAVAVEPIRFAPKKWAIITSLILALVLCISPLLLFIGSTNLFAYVCSNLKSTFVFTSPSSVGTFIIWLLFFICSVVLLIMFIWTIVNLIIYLVKGKIKSRWYYANLAGILPGLLIAFITANHLGSLVLFAPELWYNVIVLAVVCASSVAMIVIANMNKVNLSKISLANLIVSGVGFIAIAYSAYYLVCSMSISNIWMLMYTQLVNSSSATTEDLPVMIIASLGVFLLPILLMGAATLFSNGSVGMVKIRDLISVDVLLLVLLGLIYAYVIMNNVIGAMDYTFYLATILPLTFTIAVNVLAIKTRKDMKWIYAH